MNLHAILSGDCAKYNVNLASLMSGSLMWRSYPQSDEIETQEGREVNCFTENQRCMR